MGESSGGVQIQGTPQIIKQEVPGPLSTLEIWEHIGNHRSYDTTRPPPNKPPNGSIIVYDKSVVDFFRQDGYEWKTEKHNPRKHKDIEIQGYYACGIPNENFQRRLYWTKDGKGPNSNIVVVHYLELEEQPSQRRRSTTTKATIKYGKGHGHDKKRKKVTEYETGSSSWTNSNHLANYGIASRAHHHRLVDHHTPLPPATYEEDAIWDELDRQQRDELGTEPDPGIPQSNDIGPSCSGTLNHQANTGSGITSVQDDQQFDQASFDDSGTTGVDYQQQNLYNEDTGPRSWINHQANTESSILSADHEQLSDSHFGDNHEEQDSMIQYADLSSLLGDTGAPIDAPTEIILPPMPESPAGSNVVICSIDDFAPDWGYAYTSTKVLITGSFINSDQQHGESCQWYCVFGEDEVRAEYRSMSNLRCYTPLKKAGRVEFYVKTSHGSVRSDVMLFEFRDRQNQEIDYSGSYGNIEVSQTGFSKPLPTSITPLTIDPSHEQRMSEVDQVPDLLELLCEAPPDDKDCHHIDAMQAPKKYGSNKSRRWYKRSVYKGVSDFLSKLRIKVGLLPSILKAGCEGLS
ncbi:PREDICTED: calmodulin-binding transcription activator 3-like [Fragaria vesca subsp. vesca]|uniref:calmodulin-binding transcription activator 3-like n=1 Tax=Fragaria vesca subsp. vesca TaxID=101020 RepID=UPI0002C3563B|nr:PREDICTED: calmodulin-binding transcription activator 3-like [Fragaria vesca subsp. vesca]